jgi:phage terminase large subunit-like protein
LAASDKVQAYIDGVVDGTIPTGKLQRLAVERHLRDLLEGEKRGLRFDEEAGKRVIAFFEDFLHHSKGQWAGEPFITEPWEAFLLWVLFGWMAEDGSRRFNVAYVEMARKNGKSMIGAGVGLYLTIADGEPGANVYSAATKKDQARIVHSEAVRMVRRSSALKTFVSIPPAGRIITVPRLDATYEPLSKDSSTMDGLNVHGAIVDELHAHRDRGVWDVLTTATGSRRQSLIFAITTAGHDRESVCWEEHDYAQKVLEGLIEDDSFFAFVASIDEDDDWLDPEVWKKANPNYGVSVSVRDMKEQAEKARQSPAFENAFRRLKLCQWTQQATRWLNMDDWAATSSMDAETLLASVVGKVCYAGIDLSSTTDLTALSLVFRDEDHYAVVPYFWVPEDKVEERSIDRVPYSQWVKKGHILATPGNVIDYSFVREKILELKKVFRIREIAYDPWAATQLTQELESEGLTMVPFRQGYASMTAPTKELLNLVLAEKLEHANNPVLKWQAGNLAVTMDAAGNVKPAKDKSTGRIDGIVATIMGIDRASRHPIEKDSVYKKRGFLNLDA